MQKSINNDKILLKVKNLIFYNFRLLINIKEFKKMFLDLQGLIQEIENEKSTENIVAERLEYLNSEEYQKNMQRNSDSSKKNFIQGFISDDEKIGFGLIDTTCYWMDEKEIFKILIDSYIRNHVSEIKQINALQMR